MARPSVLYLKKVIKASASYATVNNHPYMFDLSKATNEWWANVTSAGDIVVYSPATDSLLPRHVCGSFSINDKIGWVTADCPIISGVASTYELHVIPGYGAVNSAAAHTNSGCYSSYGYDEASGNVLDKTGAYNGSPSALTYDQVGSVCKSIAFNAANSHVNMGVVSQVSGATQHTFQFLMSKNDIALGAFIMRLGSSSTDYAVLYNSGNQLTFQIAVGGTSTYARIANWSSYVSNGVFFLFTIVFDGTQVNGNATLQNQARLKIYINDANVCDTYISNIQNAFPTISTVTKIGYDSSSFLGKIDESRFYSRPVTQGEIIITRKNWLDYDNAVESSTVRSQGNLTGLWKTFKPRFRLGL